MAIDKENEGVEALQAMLDCFPILGIGPAITVDDLVDNILADLSASELPQLSDPNTIDIAMKEVKEMSTNHSGKKLSEVPYNEIFVGMELISFRNTPGRVIGIFTNKGDEDWLHIKWDNGKESNDGHYNFSKVTVK